MSRIILHIDINSYFATLLQQENPALRGKPLGIVKDKGRTCLIAASKEAKKLGITTGCHLNEAKQLCPDIITLPAQFDRYLDATKRLRDIFSAVSPDYHIYSLDEAFIDVTSCQQYLYPDPIKLATSIQESIKKELGEWVTSNVGIGPNRLLAKIASETTATGTVFKIDQHNLDAVLATTSFRDVCGIGFRLGKKLHQLGVTVPYQIRFYSQQELEPIFGPFWSKELLKIAYGQEPHHLTLIDKTQPHMKSVGRSITGYKLYDDEQEIKRILYNLTEEVTYKVRQMNLAGRQVSIALFGPYKQYSRINQSKVWWQHKTLPQNTYIRHTKNMFDVLYHQLYKNWHRQFKIIKFAVRLSLLKPYNQTPQPLFFDWHKNEAISAAVDHISNKYGLFTLRSGILLNQPIIKPEVTGFLGDKLYHNL